MPYRLFYEVIFLTNTTLTTACGDPAIATAGQFSIGSVIGAAGPYAITGSYGSWGSAALNAASITQSATIKLNGTDADVIINGVSLSDTLAAIESRLAMLKPAKELEMEWNELKQLGDAYRKLEQEIKDKMKTWDTLKNTKL